MFDVVVVGSANLDLVATAARLPAPGETVHGTSYGEHPGGKGLNQAIAAARAGARVALVAAIGDDEAGRRLRDVATADGIDVALLDVRPATPSGRALIAVDEHGENLIVVVPGANADVRVGSLPSAGVVLAQLEVPLEQVTAAFRAARAAGSRTVLNPAPATQLPGELLAHCDVVVPNEHEIALVGGVDALLAAGPEAVVVTRGALGVEVATADGSRWAEPAFEVDPVDSTAAGDAFCGALAARLAAGDQLDDAVRWASAAGALATTRRGAVPSLPTADRIDALVQRDE